MLIKIVTLNVNHNIWIAHEMNTHVPVRVAMDSYMVFNGHAKRKSHHIVRAMILP